MQAIAPVTNASLLARGQRPQMKLEINVGGWIDITALADPATGKIKNYLQDISFSSGGARMTPNPIAGEFSATISNEGNIFHPNHPTSPYTAYFRAGREVRIKLGGTYTIGGVKLWQRIIGYMDEPEYSSSTFELTIKGLDYMKTLSDMKFTKEFSVFPATPIDNMWGALEIRNSETTAGSLGPELYAENDAMEIGAGEANNVTNWNVLLQCTFVSFADVGGGSTWVGRADTFGPPAVEGHVKNIDVHPGAVAGEKFKVDFKYRRLAGGAFPMRVSIYQLVAGFETSCGSKGGLSAAAWTAESFYATALTTGPLGMRLQFGDTGQQWRIDQISIKKVTVPTWYRYAMPASCTGIYYVELNEGAGFLPVWPGKQGDPGEGWYYDKANQYFYFDEDKNVDTGAANLRIYYYTAHAVEDVVADLLAKAGLYANRAAALVAMGAPATGVNVDRVRFKAGLNYIKAMTMLCERVNWRFYFNHNGTPVFVTAPTIGAPVFTTLLPEHFTAPKIYQDRNEIRNRIVIQGEKVAELTGWEDNMPSELKDEASDAVSIATYKEHTKTINNILFQDLASITAMCATLLAAGKDPKWYLDFTTPYNAVPLELGDTVLVQELLDITLPVAQRHVTHTSLIRNAGISQYDVTYKCEL